MFSLQNEEKPGEAAALPAPDLARLPPPAAAFRGDALRDAARQSLIDAGIAGEDFGRAEILNRNALTPDLTAAVVLRRKDEVLAFHPALAGVSWAALVRTLKRLDGMDGLHATVPEDLRIDLYRASAPGRPWIEPRFIHRGLSPEDIDAALRGRGELLPCGSCEEAQRHPFGIAVFQGLGGGAYGYAPLGAGAPGAARLQQIMEKLIAPFTQDDFLTLTFEAVRDRPAILESPRYLGVGELRLEETEDAPEPAPGSNGDSARPHYAKLRVPETVYVRREIAEKIMEIQKKRRAAAKPAAD